MICKLDYYRSNVVTDFIHQLHSDWREFILDIMLTIQTIAIDLTMILYKEALSFLLRCAQVLSLSLLEIKGEHVGLIFLHCYMQ